MQKGIVTNASLAIVVATCPEQILLIHIIPYSWWMPYDCLPVCKFYKASSTENEVMEK